MEHKEPIVYAFIDSQNLKMGVGKDVVNKKTGRVAYRGWEIDLRKFRLYLKNKYNVTKAYFFIGNIPGNERYYTTLQEMGYEVVLKPTMPYTEAGILKQKGNVDAELVLYASALVFDKYDKALIISGDGDFLCLVEYLDAENKLLMILAPNKNYSSLLNKYAPRISLVAGLRQKLERKKPKYKK
jgi:uncharacterized LabA/DUF88 family protein